MSETFYSILGVAETASKDEIKKAYRKLSLQWHPDRNHGSVEANSKFQKINEAYETLSNDIKKKEYDNRNNNPFSRMNSMGGNGEMPFNNVDEFFANFFGGMPMGGMPGMPGMGGMPGMPGMGGMPGMFGGSNIQVFRNGVQVNMMQKPVPIVQTIVINMEQVLNGAKIPIDIERWILEGGNKVFEKETLYIEIPKGIDENEIIILRDKGNVIREDCKGDIKLFIKIDNSTDFKRSGLDLIYEKTISLKESLCGFNFELKYINGKTYTINNNSGNIITPNYNKIIPNMGLTRESYTGNLIINFKVVFPESLTIEKIEELKQVL